MHGPANIRYPYTANYLFLLLVQRERVSVGVPEMHLSPSECRYNPIQKDVNTEPVRN